MSDKLGIEAIKARVRDAERSLDDQKSGWCRSDLARRLVADLAALLAEVERLRRERSEWCDRADQKLTEYMTQQRDLLAENAALRARLTVDDAMVERGARGVIAAGFTVPVDDAIQRADPEEIAQIRADVRIALEAALLAAGMEEEQ